MPHTIYAIVMRRTTLALDRELLDEARKVSGAKTYSAAVSTALTEYRERYVNPIL